MERSFSVKWDEKMIIYAEVELQEKMEQKCK